MLQGDWGSPQEQPGVRFRTFPSVHIRRPPDALIGRARTRRGHAESADGEPAADHLHVHTMACGGAC
jgi:hypothetical protein